MNITKLIRFSINKLSYTNKMSSSSHISQSSSYEMVEGRLRYVTPYIHEFKTFAKGRWIGKELYAVITKEFGGGLDDSYWAKAIEQGQVKINNNKVTQNYIIRQSDSFTHLTHRHEPPVIGDIEFVGENDDILAVSKPASMPVHPCGAYRQNSLTYILSVEPFTPSQPPLHLVHRIDRVTSGLLILAKSSEAANRVSKDIRDKSTKKVYLARVKGRFPGRTDHLRQLSDEELAVFIRSGENDDDEVITPSQPQSGSSTGNKGTTTTTTESGGEGEGGSSVGRDNSKKRAGGGDQGERREYKKQKIERQQAYKDKFMPNSINQAPSSSSSSTTQPGPHSPTPDPSSQAPPEPKHAHLLPYYSIPILTPDEVGRSPLVGYHLDPSTDSLTLVCPLSVASYRDAVHAWNISDTGKQSITRFKCIGYNKDDDTSLIECTLLTGRTHQIRLHLQLLGSPIANDPCYGGELFYGENGRLIDALVTLQVMARSGVEPVSKVPKVLLDKLEEYKAKPELFPLLQQQDIHEEDGGCDVDTECKDGSITTTTVNTTVSPSSSLLMEDGSGMSGVIVDPTNPSVYIQCK